MFIILCISDLPPLSLTGSNNEFFRRFNSSNQVAINTQILAFMKNPVVGAAGSPVVGSNSAVATPSRQAPVSCTDKAEVKAPPITRTHRRRAGKSAIKSKANPTYVPDSTPISSSKHGTFHFTRSNKRSTPSSRRQRSGTASIGKRKLFPMNKGPPGMPPLTSPTSPEIGTKRCAIPHDTVAFIKKDFMGKANRVYKIYCPIKCDDHWFLVIINTLKDEFVFLDSCKSPRQRAKR
ncbi:hypothetical protein PIB30_052771 [Stylosanthes scabra]|uniref:Ubiquitin-like protease family profile domain-containing protein n=1 Tax=Stylosanthes scabra TaxID=79078 RepID=A0ABU6QHT3_9FABA|nr:hypothetical protein [Stylosanthes scabra]